DAAEAPDGGRRHRQRGEVERPPREQTRDSGEHAGLVLDQDGERVVRGARPRHQWPPSPCAGSRMMSSFDPPAGTIGYTFSKESTRKSMTTGRSSTLLALSTALSTSSGASTRSPTQPMASAHFT